MTITPVTTTPAKIATAADVLAFWRDAGPDKWFAKDDAFDAAIKTGFGEIEVGLEAGAAARLDLFTSFGRIRNTLTPAGAAKLRLIP